MRTISNSYNNAYCFDAEVWKQERNLIQFTNTDGQATKVYLWTDLDGSQSSPLATYTLASTKVIIDMSDYIRTYGDATIYMITNGEDDAAAGEPLEIEYEVVGLINPESVYIPCHPLQDYGALIVPPSVMYYDGDGSEIAEVYSTTTLTASGDASLTDNRYVGEITGAFTLSRLLVASHTFTPRAMLDDRQYALVDWVSFTGQQRVHYWEVVKNTTATADTIDLLTLDNSYNEIKGREDGLTLRLDGLDAYDFWYYADIITSSEVFVTINDIETQVQVTTKSVTIPDGNATDGKLEISINWKRYDAVGM